MKKQLQNLPQPNTNVSWALGMTRSVLTRVNHVRWDLTMKEQRCLKGKKWFHITVHGWKGDPKVHKGIRYKCNM